MQLTNIDSQRLNVNRNEKPTYEAPAIIYKGIITTRAGSGGPVGDPSGSGESSVDPADLFGDD